MKPHVFKMANGNWCCALMMRGMIMSHPIGYGATPVLAYGAFCECHILTNVRRDQVPLNA